MIHEGLFTRVALAGALTLGLVLMATPRAEADGKGWEYMETHVYEDGSKTHWYTGKVTDPEGKETQLLKMVYLDKDNNVIKEVIDAVNPAPDSADPDDAKPVGHRDGPAPGAPGVDIGPKPEPSLTKFSKGAFEIEKGQGFSLQGQGGKDDLINPAPDDSGDSGDDKAKKKGLGEDDIKSIGQSMKDMQQLLQEQFPGVELSLVGIEYIQLHNPAEKSQGQGGGGAGDAAAASSVGTNMGPPSMQDAAMQSLINPDPLASSMAVDQALGGLPGAPDGGAGAFGGPAGASAVSSLPQLGGAQQPQGGGMNYVGGGGESNSGDGRPSGRPKP